MRVCPKCSHETLESACPRDGAMTVAVAPPSQQTYALGTMIADRYRIDGVIGIGGFGAVYKCTQLNMDQVVAVKVLRADHLSSSEHVKRFSGEAQAVSRLRHPNTIRVFDFGTHTDGALYLAMEYVEGETLGRRFDTKGALPWLQLVHILVQVCHSLTEAHASGLVHRDLKPENVMLLPVAGDPDFVKVLDFGIAKQQKTSDMADNLTESGMIMGTPTYMSPEQAKGEPIDGRSDVYALGILAYEALMGRPPFVGETPMTVLVKHIKDPVPAFIREGALREVPRELEALVHKCLAKDPRSRPQDTAELAESLTHIAENARRPTPTATVTATMPAHPDDERATQSLAQLNAAQGVAPVRTAQIEASHPPASRLPLAIAGGAFVLVAGVAAAIALSGGRHPIPEGASVAPSVIAAPVVPVPSPAQPAPVVVAPAVQAPPAPPVLAAPQAVAPSPVPPQPAGAHEPAPTAAPAERAQTEPNRVEPKSAAKSEVRAQRAETAKGDGRPEPRTEAKTASSEVKADAAKEPVREKPGDRGHNHEAFRLDDDHPDPPKR